MTHPDDTEDTFDARTNELLVEIDNLDNDRRGNVFVSLLTHRLEELREFVMKPSEDDSFEDYKLVARPEIKRLLDDVEDIYPYRK